MPLMIRGEEQGLVGNDHSAGPFVDRGSSWRCRLSRPVTAGRHFPVQHVVYL